MANSFITSRDHSVGHDLSRGVTAVSLLLMCNDGFQYLEERSADLPVLFFKKDVVVTTSHASHDASAQRQRYLLLIVGTESCMMESCTESRSTAVPINRYLAEIENSPFPI